MKERKTLTRYVGIDLGKKTYEMAVVGKGGKVTKSNGKTHPFAPACSRQACLLQAGVRGFTTSFAPATK